MSRLQDVILRGTRASQPLATAVSTGTLYYVTDELKLERSSGSAWQDVSATSTAITALTGDVTATGPGSVAATIGNNKVTNAMIRQSGALAVVGRSANSAGNVADIQATAASDQVLRESGSTIGFGTIATAGIAANAVTGAKLSAASRLKTLPITIDGGGSAITTGAKKVYVRVPWACTIKAWTLVADQSGSIVLDLWKDSYANFPPTVADTITASAKPTLSTAQKNTDSTLTGWTTSLSAGDFIEVNVDSATTVTKVQLYLDVEVTT